MSGVIFTSNGVAGLTKTGPGLLALSAADTYNGPTTITAGTLQLGNAGTTGTLFLGSAIVDNGTFAVKRTNAITQGTDFSPAAITGTGGLWLAGGTLTLNAANTYSGPTLVTAGILELTQPAALYNDSGSMSTWTKTNISVASGATLAVKYGGPTDFTQAQVSTALSNLAASINNNGLESGAVFGLDTTNAYSGATYGGVIANSTGTGAGSLGLLKLGNNTLTLSAANTYTGTTTVPVGTLALTGTGTLGGGTAPLLLSGGQLDLGGASQTVGAVTVSAAASNGDTIKNGTLTGSSYTVSNATVLNNAVISASLAGPGGLTGVRPAFLVLTGSNSYTGQTAISAGNLVVSSLNNLGTGGLTPLANSSLGALTTVVQRHHLHRQQ